MNADRLWARLLRTGTSIVFHSVGNSPRRRVWGNPLSSDIADNAGALYGAVGCDIWMFSAAEHAIRTGFFWHEHAAAKTSSTSHTSPVDPCRSIPIVTGLSSDFPETQEGVSTSPGRDVGPPPPSGEQTRSHAAVRPSHPSMPKCSSGQRRLRSLGRRHEPLQRVPPPGRSQDASADGASPPSRVALADGCNDFDAAATVRMTTPFRAVPNHRARCCGF